MVLEVQAADSRRFFVIPQAPEDAGYYVYGTPVNGRGQYAHSALMTGILRVEREWQAVDDRKFGIGNISLAAGLPFPGHATHKSGLEVDIRPLRKDGAQVPVSWTQPGYDREATAKLLELFRAFTPVVLIYFNDTSLPFVIPLAHHDNHFHLKLRV